jgi:hypothetical protein
MKARIVAAVTKAVAWLFGAWLLRLDAKRDQRRNTALQAAEAYAKKRQKIDAADIGEGNEDDDRKWLAGAADRLRADK